MLNRRSFLQLIPSLTVPLLLSSCSQIIPNNFNIILLKGSIPVQLIGKFQKKYPSKIKANFKPEETLDSILKLLKNNQTQYNGDLFTLGNYWLQEAIEQDLLESFEVQNFPQWQNLPPQLKNLIQVENNPQKIWGMPYRWGNTVIVYRKDLFTQNNLLPPQDWADLWREDLKNKIGLLNQPREIIGLTLKKLGYSYNTTDLSKIPNLKSELLKLNQQVKFYSSNAYLQPLIVGDILLSVGWSEDIFPIKKAYPNLEVIVPPSGTSLWAEIWVKSKNNQSFNDEKITLLNQWLNFCWEIDSANQIALFTSATSPIISSLKPENILPDLKNNSLLNLDPTILNKSEVINPLAKEVQAQYLKLWEEMTS